MTNTNEVEGFDLGNFEALASSEGVWMQVRHPVTDAPLKNTKDELVRIKLVGRDSPQFLAKSREFMNKRIKRGKLVLGSAEQLEVEKAETLAACTMNWEGMLNKTEVFPFTSENAYSIYSAPKWRWIADQVDEFIGDRANFLQR